MSFTIRVRTPSGVKRINANPSWTIEQFYSHVAQELGIATPMRLLGPSSSDLLLSGFKTQLKDVPVRNADMWSMKAEKEKQARELEHFQHSARQVDKVDVTLSQKDGTISRSRTQLCRHPHHGSCAHCIPLQPYDPAVLASVDSPIKFLSFQSFLRKIRDGDKFAQLPEMDCAPRQRSGKAISTPRTVVLKRQEYRHVDYVEFETYDILDKFLQAWRATGVQRAGFMYGTYEEYEMVPLGVKATVKAIYEPPQMSDAMSIQIDLNSAEISEIDVLAHNLGMKRIGWIFTDLEPTSNGKVKYKRFVETGNPASYMISADEILNAAAFQNQHLNAVSRQFSSTAFHGSKFTTVIVSGNENEEIVPLAYQATTQAMELVKHNLLCLSDNPAILAVHAPGENLVMPDILYTQRDEYNNEIQYRADPMFPAAFLSVDLPVGGKVDNKGTFSLKFPIENRPEAEQQSVYELKKHLERSKSETFLSQMSDFHLLVYIVTNELFSSLKDDLPPLLKAIKEGNLDVAEQWACCEQWQTIRLVAESAEKYV
eukprot:gene2644-5546_t